MDNDQTHLQFHQRSRTEKTINSLLGLLTGINIDSKINTQEITLVQDWLTQHDKMRNDPLMHELFNVVEEALEDKIITEDELADIQYFSNNILGDDGYFNQATRDIQVLHGILCGIVADNKITKNELLGLREWLENNEHLKKYWPYDEVDSIITAVLADGIIDDQEHEMLKRLFIEFIDIEGDNTITNPPVKTENSIVGLCAVCPDIIFTNSKFCFTGASQNFKRKEFEHIVIRHGGIAHPRITQDLDYLVIGAAGNPTWAFSCYGRKVEKAVELRKEGFNLSIIHENDFHDALLDFC